MSINIRRGYRFTNETEDYQMSNETRVSQIGRVYSRNKRYFGRRVLDIGCGGGILGFLVEPHVASYVGIDANSDQIEAARKYARNVDSECKFILGDAETTKIKGKYDTVVILGNLLSYFDTKKLLSMFNGLRHNVDDAFVIIEYVDVVSAIFRGRAAPHVDGFSVRNIGFDGNKGALIRRVENLKSKICVKGRYYVWSPYILQSLLETQKMRLIKRSRGYYSNQKRWPVPSLLDIYRWGPN